MTDGQAVVLDVTQEVVQLREQLQAQATVIAELKEKQTITSTLDGLNRQIGNANTAQLIEKYNGKPAGFLRWIRSIEQVAAITYGIPNSEQLAQVALMSSQGGVTDFLLRFIKKEKKFQWDTLVEQLKQRFHVCKDQHTLILELRKLKQQAKQTPHSFAEYINTKASEIYSVEEIQTAIVQRELVSTFVSGLRDQQMAVRVLRKGPLDLHSAVKSANDEMLIANRVEAHGFKVSTPSRVEEPMEVDLVQMKKVTKGQTDKNKHSSGQRKVGKCFKCGLEGHWRSTCRVKVKGEGQKRSSRGQGQFNGSCYYCLKPGHRIADCYARKRQQRSEPRCETAQVTTGAQASLN